MMKNKVTNLLLTLLMVGLTSGTGWTQTTVAEYIISKEKTIELPNQLDNGVPLTTLLKRVEKIHNVSFVYEDILIEEITVPVEVLAADSLGLELSQVLDGAGLTYRWQFGSTYVITPQPLASEPEVLLQKTVTGTVVDEQTGEALPGVNIVVEGSDESTGSTIGTITNMDGHYEIEVPEDLNTLVFSFIGYRTEEVMINERTEIDVAMELQQISGEELVVVGYGTQRRINVTGSVDVISSEEISKRSVTNVSEALQGVAPNLNFAQTGWSTEPGGGMEMNIRGIGSLTGDASPYVLVDGVPMDLNAVNPNDIESISILKDAAASAIYGANAPYGVILVTTKRGEMDDRVTVEYSGNLSFSSPIGLPHMTHSVNFATAFNQASFNAGLARHFSEEEVGRMERYMAGEITDETWELPDRSDWAGNDIWSITGNANNDWLHIYYEDMVPRQKHDISVRGGGSNNTYYISAGLWDQPGELRYADQYYKRHNLTANLTSEVTDWLSLDVNAKYTEEITQYFNGTTGEDRATMYHNFARTNVFRPLYLPTGDFSAISQIPMQQGGKELIEEKGLIVTLGGAIEPVEGWETRMRFNYKTDLSEVSDNKATVLGPRPDGSMVPYAFPQNSFTASYLNTDYQMVNVVSSYIQSLGNHNFNILAGYEQEINEVQGLWGERLDMVTNNVPSISTATGDEQLTDVRSHWATQSLFSRITYNYDERYLAEMNFRYDGTSRFAEENRWGFFPSFSIGYNISREEFWNSIQPYINELGLRASWGSLGNQNVDNYLHLQTLSIGTNLDWIMDNERPNYVTAPGIISAGLTWETATTLNFGIDMSFFNHRLDASFDIFDRTTTDMFGPAEALPSTIGTNVPQANNASLQTKGYELQVTWRDRPGQDFSYSVRASLADNVSTVTEYNNPTNSLGGWYDQWYEGRRVGDIWGLTTDGIYQTDEEAAAGPDQSFLHPDWGAGDIQYRDLDGDGRITNGSQTADNPGDYSVIGNSSPRYLFGLQLGASWKLFNFSMFWQGVGKRDVPLSGMMFHGFNADQWWNMTVMEQHLDYWRPADETNHLGPNTNSYYPKPYLSPEDYKNRQNQTRFVQSAAYVRLKNVSLSYTLPHDLTDRVAVRNATFFISGENLLTFTRLTSLFDPEGLTNIGWGPGKVHPLRRVFSLGINITL